MLPSRGHTRSGEHKKPSPRGNVVQHWQCTKCLESLPPEQCQWTNAALLLALTEDEQ